MEAWCYGISTIERHNDLAEVATAMLSRGVHGFGVDLLSTTFASAQSILEFVQVHIGRCRHVEGRRVYGRFL